jgi:predicted transposase/invertase (TIGR01784 family)
MDEDEFRKAFIARRAAQRPIENRRIETSVIETAEEKGTRRKTIEFAKESLKEGFPIAAIAKITKLSLEEVSSLSEGKELDMDQDD